MVCGFMLIAVKFPFDMLKGPYYTTMCERDYKKIVI